MATINDLLNKSELRTDILRIANDLDSDANYTKEEAVEDLLEFLEIHNL